MSRPTCTKVALSYFEEGAYGGGLLNVNIDKVFEPNEPILPDVTIERVTDAALLKGHEWPQDFDIIVSQDVSLPFNYPLSFELFGMLGALALGNVVMSGSNPNFIVTLKPQDACTIDQLPSSAWILGLLGDVESYLKVKGVIVNELRVVIDSRTWITLQGNVQTDGSFTPEPTYTFPSFLEKTYGVGAQAEFFTGPNVDGLVSHKSIYRGGEFSISNNLDIEGARSIVTSTDRTISELRFNDRTYQMVARVTGHQGDAFWDAFINATPLYIRLRVEATEHRFLQIDMPVTKIENCQPRFDGLRDVLELTFVPRFDVATLTPMVITVGTSAAEYLVEEAGT